jgi:anti-sigma28 factor (negative regulator of flagellin synthesis)
MRPSNHAQHLTLSRGARSVGHLARPQSLVLLADSVREAREVLRAERIHHLKLRVSDGHYAISSKRLAERVLASIRDV